jgi:hypothetical protein
MPLKIENRLKNKIYFFNIERNIKRLIKFIPQNDLIGLEKIIIVDTLHGKESRNAAAVYKKKNNYEPASIEISFTSVFKGMPSILFLIPFVAKFTLASVLYHEIGHHYHHTFKHGINKKRKEDFSNNYKKEMLKKAFWWWGILLRPLTPLVKHFVKKV